MEVAYGPGPTPITMVPSLVGIPGQPLPGPHLPQ